jgi:putative flippase GtrA
MIRALKISNQLLFFLVIGCAAALTHILTVMHLVSYFKLEPLLANIIAFFIAFNISYLGHKYLTFSQIQEQKQLSLTHFFFVASSAGILNEFLYFFLLNYTTIHYLFALIVVLGLVAVYSFFLSRYWACR